MNKGNEYRSQRITCGYVGLELKKTVNPGEVVTKKQIGQVLAELNMGSESNTRNYVNALRANGVVAADGTLDLDALKPKTIEVSVPGMYAEETKARIEEMTYRYGKIATVKIGE